MWQDEQESSCGAGVLNQLKQRFDRDGRIGRRGRKTTRRRCCGGRDESSCCIVSASTLCYFTDCRSRLTRTVNVRARTALRNECKKCTSRSQPLPYCLFTSPQYTHSSQPSCLIPPRRSADSLQLHGQCGCCSTSTITAHACSQHEHTAIAPTAHSTAQTSSSTAGAAGPLLPTRVSSQHTSPLQPAAPHTDTDNSHQRSSDRFTRRQSDTVQSTVHHCIITRTSLLTITSVSHCNATQRNTARSATSHFSLPPCLHRSSCCPLCCCPHFPFVCIALVASVCPLYPPCKCRPASPAVRMLVVRRGLQ